MKRKQGSRRIYIVITILVVAVAGLIIYGIQLSSSGPRGSPSTFLTGRVGPMQLDSNFSIMLFENTRTGVSYGAAIISNSSTTASCASLPPCTYRVSLYSNELYNVTIQVATTHFGIQNCPGAPSPITPSGQRMVEDFQCTINYP